jgi:NAD-dependent dihydropyrimidine dehydrogenase PreA subunit/coenzyme F420-reducing hydrogenase delta subunit
MPWGGRLLRALERAFLYLDRALGRLLPPALNPFLQTGAVAIMATTIATLTGIVLLVWYRPSVHMAYVSVAGMSDAPWTAGLMRSLHRYSSDAAMFFVLVHALRTFLERRFSGARWLAWVTGILGTALLWFIGWTGYWLVWDERAQHVAVGTARLLDVLPIFVDPMGRSFLTDASVNSLLFFAVFFVHMLIPLGLGVLLWLHLARLSRAHFLTRAPMTVWVTGSLLILSVAYPATNAGPAKMTALGQAFSMDWWYLAPLVVSDRLGGGALWSVVLASGAFLIAIPWSLSRGRVRPAKVEPKKCNACTQCYQDCPYEAIAMVPRPAETGREEKFALMAEVNPAKCIGCGICAGSCDTAGVGVDWFSVTDARWRFATWLMEAAKEGDPTRLAFVCAESAGGVLSVDPDTGKCDEMPGYRVLRIPCAGWLHPFGIEHTLRYGGVGALVVTCGEGGCRNREGADWIQMRLAGERSPALRRDRVPEDRLRLVALDRTRKRDLVRAATAFHDGEEMRLDPAPRRGLAGVTSAVLALLLAGALGVVSDLGYAASDADGPELVVTFKHPGQVGENCRALTEAEMADLPVHMRRTEICERARAWVRLRVTVDGEPVREGAYRPKGIWSDLNSVAVESIPMPPGEHRVRVEIGDSADPDEWAYTDERLLSFTKDARRVLVFDRLAGFTWE